MPRFWSEELLREYELPLATPERTPRHVSSEYYEALRERVLYRSYPIYRPDREPPDAGPYAIMRSVRVSAGVGTPAHVNLTKSNV